jgi:hypothetical protein
MGGPLLLSILGHEVYRKGANIVDGEFDWDRRCGQRRRDGHGGPESDST